MTAFLVLGHYGGRREIQGEFDDYTTSLVPCTVAEILEFWRAKYPGACPADNLRIAASCRSEAEALELG